METSRHKSVLGGKRKSSESNYGDEESCVEQIALQCGAGKRAQDDEGKKPPSPNLNNSEYCSKQVTKMERSSPESESRSSSSAKKEQLNNQLGSTKAEMDQVMEENQRLKMYLDQILKDYRTLQRQYRDVIQQEAKISQTKDHDDEPNHELIDLSLGMSSSDRPNGEMHKTPKSDNVELGGDHKRELSLGLDCRFDLSKEPAIEPSPNPSPENSIEQVKEDAGETWAPKTIKNVRDGGDEDEISQQNPAKRARVSVRVRCDTPTMNDGCQWRKYGQKIAKGNPCPRAYYRCTVAQSCPVRKQVQRCAEDMSILITTYEGTHNHPLPVAATAMASTTSAAASMLISGSSSSSATPGPSTSATLNGLNFYLSDNSRSRPFYLQNSSISSSPSFPTITLDLTSSSSSSSSSHLNRLSSYPPRYSTQNLNFSSLESNTLPISWNNGMLAYASSTKHQTVNSLSFGSQPYETLYQSYLQKTNSNSNPSFPPDTIAAATKAITSDPSFQSALAAALSSVIGASSNGEKPSQIGSKGSESFPILSSFPSSSNSNKCAPSFMNKSSSSTSSQPAGLMPPFPFSNSKSKSTSNSPGDHNRDHGV